MERQPVLTFGDIKIELFLGISSGTKPQTALKDNSYFNKGLAIYNSQLLLSHTHLRQSGCSQERMSSSGCRWGQL